MSEWNNFYFTNKPVKITEFASVSVEHMDISGMVEEFVIKPYDKKGAYTVYFYIMGIEVCALPRRMPVKNIKYSIDRIGDPSSYHYVIEL